MFRCILAILLGITSFLQTPTRAKTDDLPLVSIELPPDVPSDTVQISYHLVGPFGGRGGYAARQFGVTSYQIPTVIEGKTATEIRAIVYAPGCEIQKFVIPLTEQSPVSREFANSRANTSKRSGFRDKLCQTNWPDTVTRS